MNREYHKAYSSELHRDMELLVFGHGGTPLLVFPTSQGRFFEYEDRNMIGVLAPTIEAGEVQVFCTDAVDSESWYNKGVHPRVRVLRHLQYERYILHETASLPALEEQHAAAGGDRMQFRRLPCHELRSQASRCGDLLREHEWSVRYPPISGWVL